MRTFLDREQVVDLICEQQERLYSVMDARLDDRAQETLFQQSFRCSLAPVEKGRIEIHLLFLRCVFVPDELPDPKRFRFSVLDVSWMASQNIRFLKKIEQQGEMQTSPEADAISFRTIIKRDAQAKKNFKKWSGSIRKMIQKVVRSKLIENPQRIAEIITRDAFWDCIISQTGLHPAYNDQGYMDQELVAQELLVDWQGKVVGRDVPRHPLGWDLRKLCQGFSRYLVLPQLRERFMWQFIPEGERQKLNHMATAPWHIGWYELNGIPVMSGIRSAETRPSGYGSALLRDLSQPNRLEDLLSVAPYEITVPLLCYGIFSVIKPFLPDYPARISVNDSFSSVMKRQKEMIFLSLTGPHSQALANLFYGAFVDYGEGERAGEKEAKKRLRQLQSRVHDGVVILDEEFKNLQTFRNRAMLRDACIVLTNSAFEENQFEIRLSSDAFDPQCCSPAMQQVFPRVLIAFVDWFWEEYVWRREEKVQEALGCIAGQAHKLYQRWRQLFAGEKESQIPNKLRRLSDSPAGNWSELNDVIKLYTDQLEEIIEKDAGDQRCNTRKKEAALKWVSDFSKQAREEAKEYRLTADTSFANDFFHFSSIRKQYSRKWANLQIALCVFLKFRETHSEYARISLPEPWEAYLQEGSKVSEKTYEQLFFGYLSQELEAGRVISFRTYRTADCSGWYDGAKELFYLPYPDYYSDFRNWATEQGWMDLPSQRVFQKQLAEKGFLLLADNHSKSGYKRADHRMVVDPYSDTKPKVSVIKVRPDLTELSVAAQSIIQKLGAQKVPRRRDALKEK
ncbi:hypothetical protein [Pseudoflavonifractor phocaeensis]|uniref:hypothetical protein n=1 Tax=Pseudoflavonifractor phocaeensis TaxID=1870988 RepID=UPI001F3D37C6|nr:hypothetical protein [Pseudoflavonifractor phocaeensis]MCF2660959.1 hypothetical protein [Pseudoflavonifractor phocaeensis]